MMDMTLFHSLWTVVVLVTFIGIIVWAFSKKRHAAFDQAARLPLEDEQPLTTNKQNPGHDDV
jgi:cytochrome c oxidase cbb3-type subunit 4